MILSVCPPPLSPAGSHLIVETNDNSFADYLVDFANYPLNFPFQFSNHLRFVHINL